MTSNPDFQAPLWRLARELRARPLALDPRTFAAIDRQLSAAIALRAANAPRVDRDAGPVGPEPPYAVRDGVAVVPLHGVCGRHLSQMDMDCGGCDVDRVREAVLAAEADASVSAIVLDVDSPGGGVCGVVDCAAAVRDCAKPVVAYAADLCASAAYWIASQADWIVCGQTAEVGSVGVYCAVLDESVRYDRDGVRVDVFASGENKGAGYPGTSLTDGQRELMQAQVDELADIFKGAVTSRRAIADNLLDGRCLIGGRAVDEGFADGTGNLADAIATAKNWGSL